VIDLTISVSARVAPAAVAGDILELPPGTSHPGLYKVLASRPDADREGWRELELERVRMVRGGQA
jgi:hypothetical protein